jgi:hypothetical protein
VQQVMLKEFPKADISVSIVWVNVLKGDGMEAAQRAAGAMTADPRVRHFYDPVNRSGQAVSRSVGWKWVTAWDIYLFYETGAEWRAEPPSPTHWMHQLSYLFWETHLRTGEALVGELRTTMSKLGAEPESAR